VVMRGGLGPYCANIPRLRMKLPELWRHNNGGWTN